MNAIRPQIAIVDDEHSVRRALERLLRSAGMSVEVFASGAEFLAARENRAFDCVVLDLHMPVLNGFEVLQRLARAQSSVGVVAITGHDTPEAGARALAAGALACLLKPIDEQVLLDAIAAATSRTLG